MEVPEAETLEGEAKVLGYRYFDPATAIRLKDSGNPWSMLAIGIIHRAVLDYSMVCGSEYPMNLNGVAVSRTEIRNFFKSRWFAMLTIWCDPIDPEDALNTMDGRIKDGTDT